MVEDKFLTKLKKYLNNFCKEFGLRMPDFDALFTSVLSMGEIGAMNLIGSGQLEDWLEDENFEETRKKVRSHILRIEKGKSQTGVGMLGPDTKNLIELVYQVEKGHSDDILISYISQDRFLFRYLKSIAGKIKKYDLIGKFPYITPRGFLERRTTSPNSALQAMIHEGIHVTLTKNRIDFGINALDEGLCVYLHKEFMGFRASVFYFAGGGITRQYKKWAKWFKKFFKSQGIEPTEVPTYLLNQIKKYGANKYRRILVHEMRSKMGKHFESKALKYHEYGAEPSAS